MDVNDKKVKEEIIKMLDGNWANDQIGSIERLKASVDVLQECLADCLILLINKGIISVREVKGEFTKGWRIDYE
jgi:hypothetical protein